MKERPIYLALPQALVQAAGGLFSTLAWCWLCWLWRGGLPPFRGSLTLVIGDLKGRNRGKELRSGSRLGCWSERRVEGEERGENTALIAARVGTLIGVRGDSPTEAVACHRCPVAP